MTDGPEIGVPYPSELAGRVDAWSERIYAALRDWPTARQGEWTRWEPGSLVLTITEIDGDEVEPIVLDTGNEELTVEFGGWHTHDPAAEAFWDAEADVIAEHAKLLVMRWLNGDLRTAVLTGADGKWCGTTTIEPGELAPQLEAAARRLRNFHPEQVELRTPARRDWKIYPVEPDWMKEPVPSPDPRPE